MFADIHLLELHNIHWIHMKINSANPTKKCKLFMLISVSYKKKDFKTSYCLKFLDFAIFSK